MLDGLEGFKEDYISHIQEKHCLGSLQNPVPCVALCPAGVDIPGYIALVAAGRLQDAVKLIRKDNPWPMPVPISASIPAKPAAAVPCWIIP